MENYLIKQVIKKPSNADVYLEDAVKDSLKRLIFPSIEREIRTELSEKGQEQAIEVFADNLSKLLLQPPLKGKVILGIDPAFRTGCKWTVVDQTGKVLDKGVIYPHEMTQGGKPIATNSNLYFLYKTFN